jgi:Fic family protein
LLSLKVDIFLLIHDYLYIFSENMIKVVFVHDLFDKSVNKIYNESMNKEKKIHALRERYFSHALKKQTLLDIIQEAEVVEQVYNSNAIENSTLTLEDTEKILQEIDLDRYISGRELFEAKNLARVVEYINKKAKQHELDKEMVLMLHKMLLSNIDDTIAGRFRKDDEWVRV